MRYDLAVIGSGAAGLAAAIAARNKGRAVVMIERNTVGGTCVNTGCVPSKALLAAAEARHVSLDGRFPGISVTPFRVDLPRLIDAKRDLVDSLRAEKYTDLAAEWNRLGVHVTVVEALDRLAPFEEPDVSAVIEEVFTREGISVITGATITQVTKGSG